MIKIVKKLVLLSLVLLMGFGLMKLALAATTLPAIKLSEPYSTNSQKKLNVTFVASVKSASYASLRLQSHRILQTNPVVLDKAMTCKADTAKAGFDKCTLDFTYDGLDYGTQYFFFAIGSAVGGTTKSNPIILTWQRPDPQPVLISPVDGEQLDPSVIDQTGKLVIEDLSGFLYPTYYRIFDGNDKVVRQEDVLFTSIGGKVKATQSLIMRDNSGKALAQGVYYVRVFGFKTDKQKSLSSSAYSSAKIKVLFNYQGPSGVSLTFAAPLRNSVLPACKVVFQVKQDMSMKPKTQKFSSISLIPDKAIAGMIAGQKYLMTMDSDSSAKLTVDLTGVAAKTPFSFKAAGAFYVATKPDAGKALSSSFYYTVGAVTGGHLCGTAKNSVWLTKPTDSEACFKGSIEFVAGPADTKEVWNQGDQGWQWRCIDACVQADGVDECSNIIPNVTVSGQLLNGTVVANNTTRLTALTNVASNFVRSVKLYQVGIGGIYDPAKAKFLADLKVLNDGKTWQVDISKLTGKTIVVIKTNKYNSQGKAVELRSNILDDLADNLPVNGSCGVAHGQAFATKPTYNLCADNSVPTVAGVGPWTWTCLGKNGGTSADCQALKSGSGIDGKCGFSNGQNFIVKPNYDLCADNSTPTVSGSGPWNWTCLGKNGGISVSCYAGKLDVIFDGQCGVAHRQSFSAKPTTNLCKDNSVPMLYGSGPWTWTCLGKIGGQDALCYANKTTIAVDAKCGLAHNQVLSAKPTYNLCADNSTPTVAGVGPWTWTCLGSGGGKNINCQATKAPVVTDAACGLAHGQTLANKPTYNLCLDNSLPIVIGLGPWTWTCLGANGGKNASCQANKSVVKIDGVCGAAHGQTVSVKPTINLCSDASVPTIYGSGPWTWTCFGKNGGVDASCQANKTSIAVNGVCGSAHGQQFETKPTYNLCLDNSTPTVAGVGPWTWVCLGKNGGTNASCQATKTVTTPDGNNQKDLAKYANKEAFMVNDNSWQAIMTLVPVSTWTNSAGVVSKYPVLIYKNDAGKWDIDGAIDFLAQYKPGRVTMVDHGATDGNRLATYLIAAMPLGAGLANNGQTMRAITADSYLSFWSSYSDVVYVENDYEKAMQAAVYASVINAPLIIKGGVLDKTTALTGKNVICVGLTANNSACKTTYTLDQLKTEYIKKVPALTGKKINKIILTNVKDLTYSLISTRPSNQWDGFKTTKTGDYVTKFYGKHSLAAPFLAAAKHEYIVAATDNIGSSGSDPEDPYFKDGATHKTNKGSNCTDPGNYFRCGFWQSKIKEAVTTLQIPIRNIGENYVDEKYYDCTYPNDPNEKFVPSGDLQYKVFDQFKTADGFLTIVADTQSIPYHYYNEHFQYGLPADKNIFANLDGEASAELAYGRIAGFTSTDASAMIARSIFIGQLAAKNNFAIFSSKANGYSWGNAFNVKACQKFKDSGYTSKACRTMDIDNYSSQYTQDNYSTLCTAEAEKLKTNDLNVYHDHGGPDFTGVWSGFIPTLSNTFYVTMACSTAQADLNVNYLFNFGLMALRKGAIAYLGAVDLTFETCDDKIVINDVYYRKKNIGESFRDIYGDDPTTLLGDPTLNIVNEQPGVKGLSAPTWPFNE